MSLSNLNTEPKTFDLHAYSRERKEAERCWSEEVQRRLDAAPEWWKFELYDADYTDDPFDPREPFEIVLDRVEPYPLAYEIGGAEEDELVRADSDPVDYEHWHNRWLARHEEERRRRARDRLARLLGLPAMNNAQIHDWNDFVQPAPQRIAARRAYYQRAKRAAQFLGLKTGCLGDAVFYSTEDGHDWFGARDSDARYPVELLEPMPPDSTPPAPPTYHSVIGAIAAMQEGRRLAPAELNLFATKVRDARLSGSELDYVRQRLKDRTKTTRQALDLALTEIGPLEGEILPPGAANVPQAARDMAERYVYVKEVDQFWDRTNRKFYTVQAVRRAHRRDMPPGDDGHNLDPELFLFSLCPVETVDGVTFFPGESEIVHEGKERCVNTWTPPRLVPMHGDAAPFVDHLHYVCDGDEKVAGHFLDFLACLVQSPAIKIKWAPLIIGAPGIGKGAIFDAIQPAIGAANFRMIGMSNLASEFNGYLRSTSLAVVPELRIGDRVDVMNTLKPWITDSMLEINEKGIKTFSMPNRVNWLCFSNYRNATVLDDGDRRFFIHITKAKPKPQAYYDQYYAWLHAHGYALVYGYLLKRDLSNFKPNGPAPVTKSKEIVAEASKPAWWKYLHAKYIDGDHPFECDFVVTSHAVDYLKEDRRRDYNLTQVGDFLGEMGGVSLGQKTVEGRKLTVWAVRGEAERVRSGAEITPAEIADKYRYPGFFTPKADTPTVGIDLG